MYRHLWKFIWEKIYPPSPLPLMDKEWRETNWNERDQMKDEVRNLALSNPDVGVLRIMLHGPVGAGKSSFINSIDNIFQERMTCGAIADNNSGHSFTKMYQTHRIKDGKYGTYLPFVICDTMGFESGQSVGIHHEDVKKTLKGHIKDGYMFNAAGACSEKDRGYNSSPTLDDKVHCLVSVLSANIASKMKGDTVFMEQEVQEDVFMKMKEIRVKATEMRIPQVVLLTGVDKACLEVNKDLKVVYKSKKIRKKMEYFSNELGIPINAIFPVKNYHEEIQLKSEIDVLLLSALINILNFANDHVAEMVSNE